MSKIGEKRWPWHGPFPLLLHIMVLSPLIHIIVLLFLNFHFINPVIRLLCFRVVFFSSPCATLMLQLSLMHLFVYIKPDTKKQRFTSTVSTFWRATMHFGGLRQMWRIPASRGGGRAVGGPCSSSGQRGAELPGVVATLRRTKERLKLHCQDVWRRARADYSRGSGGHQI